MTLLWLDFETTGLDERTEKIVEVGWMVSTDNLLQQTSIRSELVDGADTQLGFARDVVKNMHKKSGLWDDYQNMDRLVIEDVEDEILHDLNNCDSGYKPILANSGAHFDRRWIEAHMPRLHDTLHYRILDTSGLGRFLVMAGIPAFEGVSINQHRAANDVKYAYSSAVYYKGIIGDAFDEGDTHA